MTGPAFLEGDDRASALPLSEDLLKHSIDVLPWVVPALWQDPPERGISP